MGSHWPVNIHHLLGRVAAGGDFSYGGPTMGGGAQKHKQVESWDQGPAPESAFLGPQLWDRKICMKMNEIGWSVGHGGYPQYADSNTPSPPQFQQVGDIDCHTVTQEKFSRKKLFLQQNYAENGVIQEPYSSITWNKEDSKINFKMEPGYQGPVANQEEKVDGFNVSQGDLALATVPGLNFDPTSRSFSAEELKPQPIIKKRKKVSRHQFSIKIKILTKFNRTFLFPEFMRSKIFFTSMISIL